MKKFMIGCGSIFGAFLLMGACAIAVVGDDPDDPAGEVEAEKTDKKENASKIGDTVKAGDLEYTIESAEAKKTVEEPLGGSKEAGAGQFIVIDLQVKNTGKEKVTMDSNLTQLKDPDGAEYEAEPTLTEGFFLEQLNPNATKKAQIVFDVTENPVDQFVFIGQGGFLSSKKVEIQLKK